MRMIKILTLIAVFSFLSISSCYCEESAARDIRTARGTVSSRDWVSSTIVVSYIRYHVPPDVKVYKGSSKMGFTAINVGDPVILKYYQDSSGSYQVTEITVLYSGDFPV